MGGGGSVRPPVPKAPAPVFGQTSPEVIKKGEDARRRMLASAGRQGTILSSSLGGTQQTLGTILG